METQDCAGAVETVVKLKKFNYSFGKGNLGLLLNFFVLNIQKTKQVTLLK